MGVQRDQGQSLPRHRAGGLKPGLNSPSLYSSHTTGHVFNLPKNKQFYYLKKISIIFFIYFKCFHYFTEPCKVRCFLRLLMKCSKISPAEVYTGLSLLYVPLGRSLLGGLRGSCPLILILTTCFPTPFPVPLDLLCVPVEADSKTKLDALNC